MATAAQYSTSPVIETAVLSTANTNRDGSGTVVQIAIGPTASAAAGVGKRILGILICATVTTTAGMIRFFISTDGGTTKRFVAETPVPANTLTNATTPTYSAFVSSLNGFVLPGRNGSSQDTILYASTNNAETFHVTVFSANY